MFYLLLVLRFGKPLLRFGKKFDQLRQCTGATVRVFITIYLILLIILILDRPKTCVLADGTFTGFTMDGTHVLIQPPQTGLTQLARLIRRRLIDLQEFDLIFVCVGRADLRCPTKEWGHLTEEFIATVRRFNPLAWISISGPIPTPVDDKEAVARCVNAGKVMKLVCVRQEKVRYSWLAQQFYNKQGRKANMYSASGISALGKAVLKCEIRDCSKCVF